MLKVIAAIMFVAAAIFLFVAIGCYEIATYAKVKGCRETYRAFIKDGVVMTVIGILVASCAWIAWGA